MSNIKGYKVFNSDWTCRGFQYKVGETFKHNGNIELCGSGFHFCQKASDCFNYYSFNSNNKVAEVLAVGNVETNENKSVTDEITIVREITWNELLNIVNEGNDCTGLCNTGDCNTGDYNTGNRNTGDYNIGDWNIIDCSTGLFNTEQKTINIFDKPSTWTLKDWYSSDVRYILNWNFEGSVWIYENNMSNDEKEQHPEYKTTGGYLKVFKFKEACKNMWNNLTSKEKYKVITELPNFDADKFKMITGIDVNKNNNN